MSCCPGSHGLCRQDPYLSHHALEVLGIIHVMLMNWVFIAWPCVWETVSTTWLNVEVSVPISVLIADGNSLMLLLAYRVTTDYRFGRQNPWRLFWGLLLWFEAGTQSNLIWESWLQLVKQQLTSGHNHHTLASPPPRAQVGDFLSSLMLLQENESFRSFSMTPLKSMKTVRCGAMQRA